MTRRHLIAQYSLNRRFTFQLPIRTPMSISTIRHRHSYPFPAGYVCSVDRDAMCQLIYALLPESCPLITYAEPAAWILYFSTPPIEPLDLIVIGDKLDALLFQYRKPPQS